MHVFHHLARLAQAEEAALLPITFLSTSLRAPWHLVWWVSRQGLFQHSCFQLNHDDGQSQDHLSEEELLGDVPAPAARGFAGHTLSMGSIFRLVQKLLSKHHGGQWSVVCVLLKGSLHYSSHWNGGGMWSFLPSPALSFGQVSQGNKAEQCCVCGSALHNNGPTSYPIPTTTDRGERRREGNTDAWDRQRCDQLLPVWSSGHRSSFCSDRVTARAKLSSCSCKAPTAPRKALNALEVALQRQVPHLLGLRWCLESSREHRDPAWTLLHTKLVNPVMG